jgi:putative membrane protein
MEGVMRPLFSVAATACLAFACGGDASDWELLGAVESEALETTDSLFLLQASQQVEEELAASRLARTQSRQPQVLQFSERVRVDRLHARAELVELARSRRVSLASGPTADAERQLAQLASRNGGAFDRVFLANRMRSLMAGMQVFGTESTRGRDTELRAWAGRVQQRLRESYDVAANLHQLMYMNHGFDNSSGVPFEGSR